MSGFELRQTPSRGSPRCHHFREEPHSSSATSSMWSAWLMVFRATDVCVPDIKLPPVETWSPKPPSSAGKSQIPNSQGGTFACGEVTIKEGAGTGSGEAVETTCLSLTIWRHVGPGKTWQRVRCQRATAWASSHSSTGLQGSCFTGAGGGATGPSQRQAAFSQADCVSTTFHSPRQDGTPLAKRVGLSHRQ